MALVYADRVMESTTTTGTGTLSLGGAVTGFRTFVAGVGNTNTCYYTIQGEGAIASEWEVGVGTVTDGSPDTLSRDGVISSSNGGSLVNFSAGNKTVFVTLPADAIPLSSGTTGSLQLSDGTGLFTSNARLTFDSGTLKVGSDAASGELRVTDGVDSSTYLTVGPNSIVASPAPLAGGDGELFYFAAGDGTGATGVGGNLQIEAGGGSGTGAGGNVIIAAGTDGDALGTGKITFSTFGTDVEILESGAIAVDSDTGTAGQILTSAGAGAPPTWENAPATGVTSVGAVGNNGISVSGSPVTSSGNITLGLGAITPTSVAASGTVTGSNLSGTNTGDQTITLTGNVTGSGTGSFATTIANNVVTNAKLAQVDTATFKGRTTAGTGNVEDLTTIQATALLETFTSGQKGLAPASGGGTTNFLRADGTWAAPPGGGGGGSGTVTSVDMSVPSFLSVSGNPVTTSGTLAVTLSGTALPAENGGTAQTSYASGDILYASAANTLSKRSVGFNGDVLTVSGGLPTWAAPTLTASSTTTFTNKRITPRVTTIATSTAPAPNADTEDQFNITALAGNALFAAPSGTPVDGQRLTFRIKDNGTSRVLSWNAIYRAGTGLILPVSTTINKTIYLAFIYNAADSRWDLVSQSPDF